MSQIVQAWSLPPDLQTLAGDEVQVWHVSLALSAAVIGTLRELLSPAEQARADRFHFKIDCERFSVARACLRIILGSYLQTDPAEIEFTYGEYGKPQLATVIEKSSQLKFNLAHSYSWALYAFTLGREIGVDIERIRPVGLSLPLNEFDVTLGPLTPAVLLRTRGDEGEALRWSLQTIDLRPDYVGAIAVEGHDWRLSCWRPGDEFLTERCLHNTPAN